MRSLSGPTAAVLLACTASFAHAQVLEIGDGGAMRTFDGPAVFTRQGVEPFLRKRAKARPISQTAQKSEAFSSRLGGAIGRAAEASALSPDFISAVAWRESGFHSGRVSRAGAVGEMQLMPATARALGVDPGDSEQNYRGGATYLSGLMRRYDGDLLRALAAYNAGPGAVDRYHGVPPYKETQAYVAAVMERLSQAVLPAAGPLAMRRTR